MYEVSAAVVVAAGVLVLCVSLTLKNRWRQGVPIALELWTAAGLLRLAGNRTWSSIAITLIIILAREMILVWTTSHYPFTGRKQL